MINNVDRPYPGARPFLRADVDHYFGRRSDAARLAELWQANRLTVAFGQTGSGKTSLLHAGVLPLVQDGWATALPPGRISYGARYPVAALPEHNPYVLSLLSSWSPGEPVTGLVGQSIREFLGRRTEHSGKPILTVIDQGEHLFSEPGSRKEHRREFLAGLADAVREQPRLHLLLIVREPALSEFSSSLGMGARHHVTPLSFENAVEAVKGPVKATARGFGDGAAEHLVTDLMTSHITTSSGEERCTVADHVRPVFLQVACTHLWDSLPPGIGTITTQHVSTYGDVDEALAAHCNRVIAAVAGDHGQHPSRVRAWLVRAFVTEMGTPGAAYEGMTHTAGMANAIAREFEDQHLLTSEWRSGSRWYSLLSERLIEPLRHAALEPPPAAEPSRYLRRARRAFDVGELDLAERYAGQVLRGSPCAVFRLRAEASSLLGNVAHERGKTDDAEAHHRNAAELFEAARDPRAAGLELAAAGQSMGTGGKLAGAVDELRAAVARLPHDLVLQAGLGRALWQLGQSSAAKAVYTGILGVDAGNADALGGRGEILADLGDAQGALRDLERIVPCEQPSALAAQGLAMAELGDHETARKQIGAALVEAPRNGPVLLYAARAEALAGDVTSAAEHADRALSAADPPLPPHQRQAAQLLAAQVSDGRYRG
jgi:tetratricopeptide (TPR) repeat protein